MILARGGTQSSSFDTQVEATEGLTLGKGTESEVSVTAQELEQMKSGGNSTHHVFYPYGFRSTSIPKGFSYQGLTARQYEDLKLTGYEPGKQYSVTGHVFMTAYDFTVGAIGVIPPHNVVADDNGRITMLDPIPAYFIATDSISNTASQGYIMISSEVV